MICAALPNLAIQFVFNFWLDKDSYSKALGGKFIDPN